MLNGHLDILFIETPVQIFCPFYIKLFFKNGFVGVLYSLDLSSLSDIFIIDTFFWSVACFIILLMVYFYKGVLLILMKLNLLVFSYEVIKSLLLPVSGRYFPLFSSRHALF